MPAFLVFLAGPTGRWLIIAAVALASVAGLYYKIKSIGYEERDAEARAEEAERERLAVELAAKRVKVTERVVIPYRDRAKVIEQQGQEVIHEVEKFIPVDSCDLPGGFRLLHDAAATGQVPDAAAGTDAAAVPVKDAATTVAENYLGCRLDQERLKALQTWVTEQYSLK